MTDSPPEVRNRFERFPGLTLFALTFASVLVLDVSLARLVGPELSQRESQRRFRVASPLYHHDLRSNVSIDDARWANLVYRVRTNSLGFRDATVRDVALSPAGHRIVFIGDSFTEGIGYSYEDTFVGIVAKRLADRGVEVLNAGVTSYSPITYFRKIQYLLVEKNLRFHELFVFIDVSDPFDEMLYRLDERGAVVSARASSKAPKRRRSSPGAGMKRGESTFLRELPDSLKRNSLILRAPSILKAALTRPDRAARVEGSAARRKRGTAADKLSLAGIERAIAHMDRLAELTRKSGIALTVAVYPHPSQIRDADREYVQARVWRRWASRHGLPLLDFYPCFIGRDSPSEVLDRYFIAGDSHWNEQGHQLAAAELLRLFEGAEAICVEQAGAGYRAQAELPPPSSD